MDRMDKLWREVGLPGPRPKVEASAIAARVSQTLDADPRERRSHMRQKLRYAILAAALAASLTGTALAAEAHLNLLPTFFRGDTAPAQEYVDATPRSASDENYTLTVDSSVSDETSACLLVTVKALNEEARDFLFSDGFDGIDTFDIIAVNNVVSEALGPVPWSAGFTYHPHIKTEDSVTYAIRTSFVATTTALRVRLGHMEKGLFAEVPLSPTPTVKLDINATGQGVAWLGDGEADQLTVLQVRLSPLTCQIDVLTSHGDWTHPRLLFRMADGTIHTQSQLMNWESCHRTDEETRAYTFDYSFYEVMELSQLQSVILFDTEYPLDGSTPRAVAHDAALDPLLIPMTDQLRARLTDRGAFPIPVRALTERLGGTCQWDSATGAVTCTYRGVSVTLTPGSRAASIRGQREDLVIPGYTVRSAEEGLGELKEVPQARYITDDGSGGRWVTVAPWYLFEKAWGLQGFVTCTPGETIQNPDGSTQSLPNYHDWYVIP